jgi:hypothetical protein
VAGGDVAGGDVAGGDVAGVTPPATKPAVLTAYCAGSAPNVWRT